MTMGVALVPGDQSNWPSGVPPSRTDPAASSSALTAMKTGWARRSIRPRLEACAAITRKAPERPPISGRANNGTRLPDEAIITTTASAAMAAIPRSVADSLTWWDPLWPGRFAAPTGTFMGTRPP